MRGWSSLRPSRILKPIATPSELDTMEEMAAVSSLRKEALSILLRHAKEDRLTRDALPGLHLMRFGWVSRPLVTVQSMRCMALVIQGVKTLDFGTTHLEYGAGQFLLSSIDMPSTSKILSATGRRPLLALAVEIDFEELKQVIGRCNKLPTSSPQSAVDVFHADPDLWGAVIRLLRLLDTPQHAAALTPLIRQEILYRLLAGPSGSRLLEISRQDSPSNRVARALTWLQKQFTTGFMVGDLARRVGMSPSSFHQHFKAMTGMTPIQYQRRMRLHEARKLLLVDSLGIGEASYRVGYQSPSQFTKDYRQCFSRLPKDDILAHATQRVTFSGYSPEMSLR